MHLDGVSFTYATAPAATLTDVSFTAAAGQVTGLIGENGAGKSTVLTLVAGGLVPTAGMVTAPPSLRYLSQRPAGGSRGTVTTAIERAVAPVRALETQLQELAEGMAAQPDDPTVAEAWDRTLAAADARGLWDLDDDAADFLTGELRRWAGPVLVASHDRWFLDHAADQLVDLDPSLDPHGRGGGTQGTVYSGNFSVYLRQRQALRSTWEQQFADQEEQLQRWRTEAALESSDVFHRTTAKSEARIAQKFYSDRAAATLTRRSRNARRRLEELERNAILPPPRPLHFGPFALAGTGTEAGEATADRPVAVRATNLGLANRLAPTTFTLKPGDHLLLTGPNGAGKSTLLNMLSGDLALDTGHLWVDPELRVATLTQEEVELATDAGRTSATCQPLTPGQRRRDQLQAILADPPDLLLLDEPTNHLALGLVEDLEIALEDWPGTVILCTHDRWVRHRWKGLRLHLEPAVD
ncbi:ABC-F family ATP-binding cassette domain-containing protein [Kocuria sp. JC486]|nr:ABC-F family ATP-binding cassette domain-containing protein [Kocuria sp. JC486]